MSHIKNDQRGLITLILILLGVAVLGYFVISNFLTSDQGQEIQEKANQVIETIDSTSDKVKEVTQ